ncbi:MAG: OmpH family outer membrane protein [Pseudomonadota bacterium]
MGGPAGAVLRAARALGLILWAAAAPFAASAQTSADLPTLDFRSPILTIEAARLFPNTALGQQLASALDADRAALAQENRELEEALRTEELALTEQRATLPRADFVALAADFDSRVQETRIEQDAKQRALEARAAAQEGIFLERIQPILGQIMVEAGAAVIIETSTTFLRDRSVDVTDLAIARINAEFPADTPITPAGEDAPDE